MSKKATKALNNKYYVARYNASKVNDNLTSREKSAEVLNIDRTRLSRIELGTVVPYPEEWYFPCQRRMTYPSSVTAIVQATAL